MHKALHLENLPFWPPSRGVPSEQESPPAAFMPVIALTMAFNTLAALFVLSSGDKTWINGANIGMPCSLLGVACGGAILTIYRNQLALWTPMPCFLFACSVYFGIGPLLYCFGNQTTIAYCDAFYELDEIALLRTNLLNAVGIFVVIVGFSCSVRKSWSLPSSASNLSQMHRTRLILAIFLIIGISIKYLVVVPHDFSSDLTDQEIRFLPGFVQNCAAFTTLGLFILVYLAAAGNNRFKLWAISFAVLEFVVGLLRFNKQEVLLVFLITVLGIYCAKPRKVFLIWGGMGLVVLYFFLVPVVSAGRQEIWTQADRGLAARLQFFADYIGNSGGPRETVGVDAYYQWVRLCYANAQAFTLDSFDEGKPGGTFELIIYTIIPRFLLPDKPLMTSGLEFNHLITGQQGGQSSPGFFGEAYWNGGWVMVVAACLYVGVLFGILTRFSLLFMKRGDFQWLPVVFFGIFSGLRPDDWFIPTYVGSVFLLMAYAFILHVFLPDNKPAIFLRKKSFYCVDAFLP